MLYGKKNDLFDKEVQKRVKLLMSKDAYEMSVRAVGFQAFFVSS